MFWLEHQTTSLPTTLTPCLYEFLLKNGSQAVGSLSKKTGLARTTLYSMLTRLKERGLLKESIKKGLKIYSAESPDTLNNILLAKVSEMEEIQKNFSSLLPSLRKQHKETNSLPKFYTFEGSEGLKNVLNDMLRYGDIESYEIWPINKMIDVLSSDFFLFHNKERIKRNIYTKAIWPESEAVSPSDYPFLGWGDEFKREIRIAPNNLNFSLGYWIYADKVAFLSSVSEGYGFIIQSTEMVQTLKSQFDIVWGLSTPLNYDRESVKEFLGSLISK